MGNEMPAKAHHVDPKINNELGNRCIRQLGYATCTCIETEFLKGSKPYGCITPVNNQRLLIPPFINPFLSPFSPPTIQAPHISF